MATFDNSYSRAVAWLKIILPLIALAILSTLFLVSSSTDGSQTIPLSQGDLEEIAVSQRIGGPRYVGVSDNGVSFTITADSARPDFSGNQGMTAQNILAVVETENGTNIRFAAPTGTVEPGGDTAIMAGGVTIVTSTGFAIETDEVVAAFDLSRVTTAGRIVAEGPFGSFVAGKMIVTQQSNDGSDTYYQILFTHGVNLIYNSPN